VVPGPPELLSDTGFPQVIMLRLSMPGTSSRLSRLICPTKISVAVLIAFSNGTLPTKTSVRPGSREMPKIFEIVVEAPRIARKALAGQFVVAMADEQGERIPLTIADADETKGSVTLIFQVVGKSTWDLSQLNEGDTIENLLGPLGKPTHIEKVGTVVCVGGGIGVAPLHPIARAMKDAGNRVVIIMGARTRELLIMEQEMEAIADELELRHFGALNQSLLDQSLNQYKLHQLLS